MCSTESAFILRRQSSLPVFCHYTSYPPSLSHVNNFTSLSESAFLFVLFLCSLVWLLKFVLYIPELFSLRVSSVLPCLKRCICYIFRCYNFFLLPAHFLSTQFISQKASKIVNPTFPFFIFSCIFLRA